MNTVTASEPPKQSASVSGFVLAAAITVLFNTALAWAKDISGPLTSFMTSLTGHHWTTHGLTDLILFVGLGLLFTKSNFVKRLDANRLNDVLIAAVVVAALGLVLWFVVV